MILHGLNNIVLGYFITKVDSVLIAGLMILWGISVCLANSDIDMLE